jgi:hypothetical protein
MELDGIPYLIIAPPAEHLSQLEKYNFSGERKNHWPG